MEFVWRLLRENSETGHWSGARTDLIQQNPGNHESPHDQKNHLNNVRQRDGPQTAIQRVGHGKYPKPG